MDKRKDDRKDEQRDEQWDKDHWDENLGEAARDYNEPPVPPRETMWARIEARRAENRPAPSVARSQWWRTRVALWTAAAAAVLVLGIAIGRVTVQTEGPVNVAETDRDTVPEIRDETERSEEERHETGSREAERSEQAVRIYQYAAAPVLNRAEMLLTQFRAGETVGTNGSSFTSRAVRLLTETRLLLDSPAAGDHELQRLLKDLELVLARIVRFTTDSPGEEQQWITDSMQQRSLLPRLRTQATGLSPGSSL